MPNRRTFLRTSSLALLAPFFARVAAADRARCPTDAEWAQEFLDAWGRAKATGKPLLVLAIPHRESHTWRLRGRAFGEWFNHGGDAALASLAQVEVACAMAPELAALVSGVDPEGEIPLFWLADPTDGAATAWGTLQMLPEREHSPRLEDDVEDWEDDVTFAVRVESLRGLLLTSLAPTADARAARTLAAVGQDALDALADAVDERPLADVDAAAAWLLAYHGDDTSVRHRLATAARRRIVKRRVPGSYWAVATECGEEIEDLPAGLEMTVVCGMGSVPERSGRFLRFWIGGRCP